MKVVNLDITTWIGTAANTAMHYYGKLTADGITAHYVTHKPSESMAKEMNKLQTRIGGQACYFPGQETEAFLDRDELIAAAISQFKKVGNGMFIRVPTVLLERADYLAEPARVLCAPGHISPEQLARLNELADRFNFTADKGDDACWELSRQWHKLFKEQVVENSTEVVEEGG